MEFKVGILTEEQAREICTWKYEGEYSVYNFLDWDAVVRNRWGLSIKETRENEFISITLDDKMIAYGRMILEGSTVFIGVGLKPSWCGQGYGTYIMNILIEESMKRYPGNKIALRVRSFNKRAVTCYERIGFTIKKKTEENTQNGKDEFYYMELE